MTGKATLPTLYTFRRCPYAMRARMALDVSGQQSRVREVVLRDKPVEMIDISPKGTVPVLQLVDGTVLEESLDIMLWALGQHDPENWLTPEIGSLDEMLALIAEADGTFKDQLDRYKYAARYDGAVAEEHRDEGMIFIATLSARLQRHACLSGEHDSLVDIAIFPFIRQFANTDRAWFDANVSREVQNWLSMFTGSDRFVRIMHKWPQWVTGAAEPVFPDPAYLIQ